MTNREARNKAKEVLEELSEYPDSVCYLTQDDCEWLKVAINALDKKSGNKRRKPLKREMVIDSLEDMCDLMCGGVESE